MSFFSNLRQKASFIDRISETFEPGISRDDKFRSEFKLPPTETIQDDTNADISFLSVYVKGKSNSGKKGSKAMQTTKINTGNLNDSKQTVAYVYSTKLFLTPHFLVFRDTYDQEAGSLIVNVSTIKKVEKAPSASYAFALIITLYSGTQLVIQFIGLRYRSEQFCEQLKKNLKDNIQNAKRLPSFLTTCYSEFLINKNILRLKDISPPPAGLGQQFKYPGHTDVMKEKAKLRLWFDYFQKNGQNLAMVRDQTFQKLIRIGIPNRMRGEIWDVCSGAMYLRQGNEGVYEKILKDNAGRTSQAIEEIEKDLKRSLPEYSAYQTEEGIQRLRNVLNAYSWKNPDVGYCQAMNIVCAGLLIYMTEEQAFWCLCNICDIYVPGYYSKTMYGTLLDQRVFEAFVEERLPVVWEYIEQHDIQLSIVSLPWFLSLFYTSMPLDYAIRIMDIFFMNGSKALFQVALAVIKINADDILQADDDGMFIAIIKNYFRTLDQSAHPESPDIKYRQITKFQELLVAAFKEFNVITDSMIQHERNKYKKGIFQNIEEFVKKTQLRHLPKVYYLTNENLSNIYDTFYKSIESHKISMGTGSSNMTFDIFIQFMTKLCEWCKPVNELTNPSFTEQRKAFLRKLFDDWDSAKLNELTLNDVVAGLDKLVSKDLLESINYFFSLFDNDRDDELHREEVLQMSEGLLLLTEPWKSGRLIDRLTKRAIEDDIAERIVEEKSVEIQENEKIELPTDVSIDEEKYKNDQIERYLQAASNFLQRSFEYAKMVELSDDINLIDLSDDENGNDAETKEKKKKQFEALKANAALDPTHPKILDIATFRMIILADETLELFFAHTFRSSIYVNQKSDTNNDRGKALRSMFDGIIADGRRVAQQVRRRVDSVATKSSAVSIDSTGNPTFAASSITSASANGSGKYEDLDDFTTIQPDEQNEHEELLKSSWLEVDESATNKGRKEANIDALTSQEGDLIEFET